MSPVSFLGALILFAYVAQVTAIADKPGWLAIPAGLLLMLIGATHNKGPRS